MLALATQLFPSKEIFACTPPISTFTSDGSPSTSPLPGSSHSDLLWQGVFVALGLFLVYKYWSILNEKIYTTRKRRYKILKILLIVSIFGIVWSLAVASGLVGGTYVGPDCKTYSIELYESLHSFVAPISLISGLVTTISAGIFIGQSVYTKIEAHFR